MKMSMHIDSRIHGLHSEWKSQAADLHKFERVVEACYATKRWLWKGSAKLKRIKYQIVF